MSEKADDYTTSGDMQLQNNGFEKINSALEIVQEDCKRTVAEKNAFKKFAVTVDSLTLPSPAATGKSKKIADD